LTVRQSLHVAALARHRGSLKLDLIRRSNSLPEVERQVETIIDTLQLRDRTDTPAHVLAYGEKRRLEIGMALATSPNVLLLDEPLAGMSPAERRSTRELIRDIGRTRTLVIVEHDLDAIFQLADQITVLYEGRLLAQGAPDAVARDSSVQDAYLGGLHAHEPA
jgi:branched-chain amino acid transport system permease protein